jgi:hypothetical protein
MLTNSQSAQFAEKTVIYLKLVEEKPFIYLLFIFFACPKKTNQKKRHPCPLVLRTALRSSKLPGFCKLASLKQCKILFGSFSGAQQVAMGRAAFTNIIPVNFDDLAKSRHARESGQPVFGQVVEAP